MREFLINSLINSGLEIKSIDKIIEYVDFCINNDTQKEKFKTSHHHILPKSKNLPFEKFKNLKENPWNGVHLSYQNHFTAHRILSEAIKHNSIYYAYFAMSKRDKKLKKTKIDNEKIYAEFVEEHIKLMSENRKDFMYALNKETNKIEKIDSITYKKNKEKYHHYLGNNSFYVIDINTNKMVIVTPEEYTENKEKYKHHNLNKINVFNKEKQIFEQIDIEVFYNNRSKYKSMTEVNPIAKGLIWIFDKNNKVKRVKESELIWYLVDGWNIGSLKNPKKANKGKHNGMARKIGVFDNNGNIVFYTHGNFIQELENRKMPVEAFKNSLYKKTQLYLKKSPTNKEFLIYKGWYAKYID